MNFYIADPHFGHDAIRRLCNRPFASIEEMDEAIIRDWNSRVTDNDDVYILGDFSYRSKDPITYLKRLKGRKHLFIGNHDKQNLKNPEFRKQFVEIKDMGIVNDHGIKIFCCHYPLVEWDGYYNDVLHFYGHIHNNMKNKTNQYIASEPNAYNVGVDVIGLGPRTLREIIGNSQARGL